MQVDKINMMLMRKFRNRESDWSGPIHYYIGLMLACCTQTQSQPKSHVQRSIFGKYLQAPPPNKALLVVESDQRLSIFQAFGSVIAISLFVSIYLLLLVQVYETQKTSVLFLFYRHAGVSFPGKLRVSVFFNLLRFELILYIFCCF